ncbi:MAG: carbon storage regulator CsrA [Planctomycetes bacterium]|nr:carbon storage regulator CsrA [Planctomycetota bacterium]
MLVLSRLVDETIMIGDDIEITIVDIRGDKVRIGIAAPARVPVHRKEVYLAIKQANVEAAAADSAAVDTLGSIGATLGGKTPSAPPGAGPKPLTPPPAKK